MLKNLWRYMMLRGVIALALGVFALFWPNLSIGVLVTVVGLFCILDGGIGLVFSLKDRRAREYLAISLISLVIGAVLVIWPTGAVKFLLVIFGAWLLFVGGGQVVTARRVPEGDPIRGVMMILGAVAAVVGVVLIVWPGTGIVVISWGIAAAAILLGVESIYLSTRARRLEI